MITEMVKTLQNYDFSNWAPAVCTGTGGTGTGAGESGNSLDSHSLAFGSKKTLWLAELLLAFILISYSSMH